LVCNVISYYRIWWICVSGKNQKCSSNHYIISRPNIQVERVSMKMLLTPDII